ncbi:DNA polymerase IV [Tessaracoccus antarcticus]|uniref:DNA polymerase IV n=1 Tax=Tessaracoccus antarcticus TaxID=2479848 RepID=A0A3M0GYC5_9ACTN|nr:DNA polymerase IV [Tessaracoccus antarcticus]RMB62306.1 DNA polymerase IV [Tessaracoccus antarcticus]
MRSAATILHLDLDAFFAAVEQRDKPSLRGKPVVVGGGGPRGVVATASYEARVFGVRSAMPGTEARRKCPHAAFLGGRFEAYRQSSQVVMALLAEVSPAVEPLSLDEAFVDLALSHWDPARLAHNVAELRAELTRRTGGLTASVGVGTSKFVAKVASEAAKPDGARIIAPGEELDFIVDLPVRAIPGVGPVTETRLQAIGMHTVADLRRSSRDELVRELGKASGEGLSGLAFARDDRSVQAEREAKSISTEDTFPTDIKERAELEVILRRDAAHVAKRIRATGVFARTVGIKVRMGDFTTVSKARSVGGATDREEAISAIAIDLLSEVDVRAGVRLLGVAASNFVQSAQEQLFEDEAPPPAETLTTSEVDTSGVRGRGWFPGADVEHPEFGRGWVWGSGLGRVTVRFETRDSGPGPVRTFSTEDPALQPTQELPALP